MSRPGGDADRPHPAVDVVIVSWNVREELIACLDSVLTSTGVEPRVVVVDNASADGSADAVAGTFGGVRLIRNPANLGFARAVNQGIAAGSAGWVLLLNPDTVVPAGGIATLVRRLADLPGHGMIVPRLVDSAGRPQQSAYLFPSLGVALLVAAGGHHLLGRRRRERLLIPGAWGEAERDVPWAVGAAMLVRRSAIERVGPMDESFHVYVEDMDWCERMWSAGLRIRYTPEVTVVHHGNRSGARRFGAERSREHLFNTARHLRRRHGRLWRWSFAGVNAGTAVSRFLLTRVTSRVRPTPARREVHAYWRDQVRAHLAASPLGPVRRLAAAESARRRWLVIGATYPPLHLGGYELMCSAHVAAIGGLGVEPVVLTSGFGLPGPPGGEERGEAGELVLRSLTLPYADFTFHRPGGARLWRHEWHQRRILDRLLDLHPPEVAVLWMMGGLSASLIARLRRRGIPTVVMVHEHWPARALESDAWLDYWARPAVRRRSRLLKPLIRPAAARLVAPLDARPALAAAAPVYCSDSLRREVEAAMPAWRGRGRVVHNGIDVARMGRARPDTEPFDDPIRLLYAGRVERRKGVHTAIAVLAGLRDADRPARLRITGWRDPAYAAELREQARRLDLETLIDWVDARPHPEMPDLYRRADVLLFPSIWREPFGLAPLEAMATGCTVVATGTGGSAEYLRDGDNALLFGVNDAPAAAEAVLRLAGDPELVGRLRRGGRETVRRLRIEATTDAYNRAVLGALTEHRRKAPGVSGGSATG